MRRLWAWRLCTDKAGPRRGCQEHWLRSLGPQVLPWDSLCGSCRRAWQGAWPQIQSRKEEARMSTFDDIQGENTERIQGCDAR